LSLQLGLSRCLQPKRSETAISLEVADLIWEEDVARLREEMLAHGNTSDRGGNIGATCDVRNWWELLTSFEKCKVSLINHLVDYSYSQGLDLLMD